MNICRYDLHEYMDGYDRLCMVLVILRITPKDTSDFL